MRTLCLLAALTLSGGALAQADGSPKPPDERVSQARLDEHRALSTAVRRAERATGGEILSAERVQSDGRDMSRVKVIDASGRVRVYMGDSPPREREERRTRGDDNNND